MKRYIFRVEYIGKNYAGSQIQPNNPTVQSELEKAISTLIRDSKSLDPNSNLSKTRKIKTVFSGRTDRGVSSRGQMVQFDTDESIVASRFINSVNGLLPNDISVSEMKEVPTSFHVQKSAKKRHYRYVFVNRKQRSAFDFELPLIRFDVDIERVNKALKYLEGEHDFSSFRSSGGSNPDSVCFIYKAECQKLGDTVVLDIVGNRFLYNMVRIIVGTLLYLEKNNLPPELMKEILESKDRTKAGKTASPNGLTLMKVEY